MCRPTAARYGAWGEIEQEYNPHRIHQPIRFQGQQLDQETGLHYNRFRYYDPWVGRYVTQDPIGLQGGLNLFIYAATVPLINSDPLGLDWVRGATFPRESTHPLSPLNFNTVYCDDEEIKINSVNIGRCEQSLGTTASHENSHRIDIERSNPDVCKNNKGITQIVTSNTDARLASEKTAHELELKILNNALKNPPKECSIPVIQGQIKVTTEELGKVNRGTYPK